MKSCAGALASVMLFVTSALFAQQIVSEKPLTEESNQQPNGLVPRPFAYAGAGLMGGGYSPLAAEAGGGLRIDSQHFLASAEAWYDNGHKTDDGDQPNPSGHDRGLVGDAYFRFSSGWFAGAGARWNQLSTTNYTKSGWRPTLAEARIISTRNVPSRIAPLIFLCGWESTMSCRAPTTPTRSKAPCSASICPRPQSGGTYSSAKRWVFTNFTSR